MWTALVVVVTGLRFLAVDSTSLEVHKFVFEVVYPQLGTSYEIDISYSLGNNWKCVHKISSTHKEVITCDSSRVWREYYVSNEILVLKFINLAELKKTLDMDKVNRFVIANSFGFQTIADPKGPGKQLTTPLALIGFARTEKENGIHYEGVLNNRNHAITFDKKTGFLIQETITVDNNQLVRITSKSYLRINIKDSDNAYYRITIPDKMTIDDITIDVAKALRENK